MLVAQLPELPGKRGLAGHALAQDSGRGIDVGRRAVRRPVPQFRRHVRRRSRGQLPDRLHRDCEVNQRAPAVGIYQHVVRLDVAVGDALRVRGGQRQQRVLQHHERGLRAERPPSRDHLAQGDPVNPLHDDGGASAGLLHVVEDPHHVRGVK
jgi:hypothetical protein